MGKALALAALACGIGALAGDAVAGGAGAEGDCTRLPSGRSIRLLPGHDLATSSVLAGADVISIDLTLIGPDDTAAVQLSAPYAFPCSSASPIDSAAREGPRSAAFGSDYVRFWYTDDSVAACLPIDGGSVSVTVHLTGAVEPGDPEVTDMTQAIANALVRGDCTEAPEPAPAPAPAASSDSGGTTSSYAPSPGGDGLAMSHPYEHFRLTAGASDGVEAGDGIGSMESATLEYLQRTKDIMHLGFDARGGRAAGHWTAGATALFGPIGTSGRNVFGGLAGASYDAIFDDVLSVFAIHARLLYGRILDERSAIEVSLDGAWALDGPPVYAYGAGTVSFADAAELDVMYSRGLYAIGVDYRELLGGRFLGVSLGFGLDTSAVASPSE